MKPLDLQVNGYAGTDFNRDFAVSFTPEELASGTLSYNYGGMIPGEERVREFLAGLYGMVGFYEGRPSAAQSERAEARTPGSDTPHWRQMPSEKPQSIGAAGGVSLSPTVSGCAISLTTIPGSIPAASTRSRPM